MTYKRKKIIGALLLTVGTLAATVIWQFEKPGSLVWDNGFKYQTMLNKIGKTYQHEIPTEQSKITKLEIDVKDATVEFIKGDKFAVTTYILSAKDDTKVSFDAGQLTVKANGDGRNASNVDFVTGDNKIVITIPKTRHLSTIVAKSSNGDLDFENIAIKNATITATNGDIKVEKSEFDNLTAINQNGEIKVKQTRIALGGKITNQNGDIEIKKSHLPKFYVEGKWGEKDIETSHDLKQSSQSQAKLVVSNKNGDIEID
ncbi:DUF4097 family beta strand repeat-containing protein [Pseudolactococcus yaeyamensis]